VSSGNLVYNSRVVTLRGENFNNEPATRPPDITLINANNADYAQASTVLGENAIRFGLDWNWYNINRSQFFQVLDQHVAWAKANHLWLIPVIFLGPGGTDFGGYSGQGTFWGSASLQQTLTSFWSDFASHYANEPTIAGYDIVNEPAPPSAAVYSAWSQATYNAITAVDPHHFVVLEVDSADWNLPSVSGTRILWEGHCYAAVATNGCNFPGNNAASPTQRPYLVGEVGSTPSAGVAFVPGNLAAFNQLGVSWTHFVMHETGYGLYQNWGAGDFSSAWTAMIQAVQAAAAGAVKPR
jgi:hypothetical protein